MQKNCPVIVSTKTAAGIGLYQPQSRLSIYFVTVQPSGFTVTESAHLKFAIRQRGGFHSSLYAFSRTLQQVQSPGLNCYLFFAVILHPVKNQNCSSQFQFLSGQSDTIIYKQYCFVKILQHSLQRYQDTIYGKAL